ncbi:MAG: quinolinate synthase [Nitrospirae bacterium GWC2_57_13]|nr:MAG: quinolinate synthase [Nitrospirae bacterium GWC1_57_7]OGW29367.1 MAG: quinolinate synthase [Nitrospirae bacterium GWC2_57_13]
MKVQARDAIVEKILEFKKKRNAIILAHNYQRAEVQEIADITGDSLELSRAAAKTDNDVIVFCGVHFMAESAAILSPRKTVLLPEMSAGCPMADMVTVEGPRKTKREFYTDVLGFTFEFADEFTLRDIKKKHPGVPVVAYVNTSAAVKAESDICCTSSNVVKVIESLKEDTVICIPDRNLSAYAAKRTKKKIISWDGFCNVHMRLDADDVKKAKTAHPDALLVVHPECPPEVQDMADHITSTSGMLRYCKESPHQEFIIGTEEGLLHRLRKDSPAKKFHVLSTEMVCPNMKRTRLESVVRVLETMDNVISVADEVRVPAKRALDRMLGIV